MAVGALAAAAGIGGARYAGEKAAENTQVQKAVDSTLNTADTRGQQPLTKPEQLKQKLAEQNPIPEELSPANALKGLEKDPSSNPEN